MPTYEYECGAGHLFEVHRIDHPYLWFVEEHAKDDHGVVIFSYRWRRRGEEGRHFFLLDGVSPKGTTFYTVNDFRKGPAYRAVLRHTFVKDNLQFQRVDPHYRGWFLTLE